MTGVGGREKRRVEERFRACGALGPDKEISGPVEAVSFDDTVGELRWVVEEGLVEDRTIQVGSEHTYEVIADFVRGLATDRAARVNTKYKTVDRKVRPVVAPLPEGSELRMKGVVTDPPLRNPASIGHRFTDKTLRKLKVGGGGFLLPAEEVRFWRMLGRHGKAFAFSPKEIGCMDPMVVEPMVIFTVPHVPHVPWNLKPIPVPRTHIPELMELLKQKMEMGILEPSSAPYSNRWFTVP
jgi:hypothetical protein